MTSTNPDPSNTFDLIIAGGGVVGLSLALDLLNQSSFKIAVVDPQKIPQAPSDITTPGDDGRCLALAAGSLEYLRALHVDVNDLHGCDIHNIEVSDAGHIGKCYLRADELKVDKLGVVAPLANIAKQLQLAFVTAQQHSDRITVISGDTIDAVHYSTNNVTAQLSSKRTLTSKLMVFADGGRSPVTRLSGFEFQTQDYNQTALIANVQATHPHQHWAYERFTSSGPLALLPLINAAGQHDHNSGHYSLVWTLDSDDSQTINTLVADKASFLAHLTATTPARFGRFVDCSARTVFPLKLTQAKRIIAHRSVVVGNAAQALHPIAGQGFNLGLRDVQDLVTHLIRAEQRQADIGAWLQLTDYAQCRQADRKRVINSTDGLVHLFSNQHWPLVAGRNVGLLLLDKFNQLKQPLARRAMGFR